MTQIHFFSELTQLSPDEKNDDAHKYTQR